jgi:hypothetical protein
MSRALTVVITTPSSVIGAAAVITGVRSGARHTVATCRDCLARGADIGPVEPAIARRSR